MISSAKYMPILKWRQGEYQALLRLEDKYKDVVLPLFVIPPVEYDFEEKKPKKTVQEHIEPFSSRYKSKWGDRAGLIDLHESLESELMDNGSSVIEFIFESLHSDGLSAIPVVRLSHGKPYIESIRSISEKMGKGVSFRVELDHLMKPSLDQEVQGLIQELALDRSEVDLVIDLGVPPKFEPYPAFAKALVAAITRISNLVDYRSFFIAGMSLNLSEIKRPGGEPIRHEWFLYQELVRCLREIRVPDYGDYTIESPEFISQDMRLLNPAGKIVYTTEKTWFIPKGKSFRDNRSQMVSHCKKIIASGYYSGERYSDGDRRIFNTANDIEGTGNQGTWKQVGVSHHIVFVVNQIARFHGL
ncbi:beta family protein [Alcanivorax sp.]|uniref:beta family protein n=1 Tax=Alcanivorax sp. TaxID=1872427 RepID=UPI002B275264|nr:beta family protein [Alcanivorax sp.]